MQEDHPFLETLPLGIIIVNEKGVITFINQNATSVFGYDQDELLNEPISKLVPEKYRINHEDLMNRFIQAPTQRIMGKSSLIQSVRKDGSLIPVEIGLNPVNTPEGLNVIATVIDLSNRQDEIQDTALAKVVESATHELSQPITAILGITELLMDEIEKSPHLEDDLKVLQEAVIKAKDILARMRMTSKFKTKPYLGGVEIADFDSQKPNE